MTSSWLRLGVISALLASAGWTGAGSPPRDAAADAARRLVRDAHGRAAVTFHRATGVADLVTLIPGALPRARATSDTDGMDFLLRYGSLFGIRDPHAELAETGGATDSLGHRHVRFRQLYRGVPVLGGELRAHSDAGGELIAVGGVFVPGIELDPVPAVSSERAERLATMVVAKGRSSSAALLQALPARLHVLREGLMRGVPGTDHLVWRVEVVAGALVRDLVYVDAHQGHVVERYSAIDTLNRAVAMNNRDNVVWSESDPLPYSGSGAEADREINQLIATAAETYRLFENLSGGSYLSWDGRDGTMLSLYDPIEPGLDCPNAYWNGSLTAFCPGMTSDDVIAHEWGHAYTQGTHGLYSAWQVGALSESFSDIFGEIVDFLNEGGPDDRNLPRLDNACATAVDSHPGSQVDLISPAALRSGYPSGGAQFNPSPPWSVTARIELADDRSGTTSDACEPLVGFTPGRIALIDRGQCLLLDKVRRAEQAGAVGVIVANVGTDEVFTMNGEGVLSIPSVVVGEGAGEDLRAAAAAGGEAKLSLSAINDPSERWLQAEDTIINGTRDLWNPGCFEDPGKVSDGNYWCSSDDSGGVHANAGVPNHAFALIVDGGTYNGHSIEGIGLTRAAHIYWRAMSVHQGPLTDFALHADALELSCQDLVGAPLPDLESGDPSGVVISPTDCDQVAEAMLAVEARRVPPHCAFVPLLDPDPPAIRGDRVVYFDDLDGDPGDRWTVSNEGSFAEYRPRDWEWRESVPEGGSGGAFFAANSGLVGDCVVGSDDQSGVMSLFSPVITLPTGKNPVLAFDHYIASEAGYDGGNLKLSVNGGAYQLIDRDAFAFNEYNLDLATADEHNTNPMAGQPAFSGTDLGTVRGSWGQSHVDLSGLAQAGDTIRIRFDFGADGCNGAIGWYVDNVRVVMTRDRTPRKPLRRVGG